MEFPLRQLIEEYPTAMGLIFGSVVLFFVIVLAVVWLVFGPGPRRRRGLRACRKLLKTGAWQAALTQLERVRAIGSSSSTWRKRFEQFEAECLQAAATASLSDNRFEEALQHGLRAARHLDKAELDVRVNVQGAMLREIRRLFSRQGETAAVLDLIGRTLQIQSPCREASFWKALCDLRNGAMESALTHLQAARMGQAQAFNLDEGFTDPAAPGAPSVPPSPFVDPPLYLGALLLRTGQAKESLRFLTEANRMDANCPFVTLQLGAAIVSAGGDTNMAVRALQRALGPKGLGMWQDDPNRAWVEGFPEHRSYVRRLASEFTFTCPLFGEDLKYLIRQGNLALAQGYFKLGQFLEAAERFEQVLKEGAPSLLVLRGLGLSLARLGRFDDAFVHLRTAHEMEDVKDRLTAGYLALCGACGTPARPEDKLQNTAWAIRLVTQFNAPGDPEWIGILNRIFAEARRHEIALSSDEQLYLCEHLVSVKSCDALSAQAYHHLLATAPDQVHPEYAWLYCRADQQLNVGGDQALALYVLTFASPEPAREFFTAQGWDFDAVELMFLARAAQASPGRFPEILGPDYPARGEQLLLARSRQEEEAGDAEAALQTIAILVALSPGNTSALDRAAALHYRAGRLPSARALLEQWQESQPTDPLPLVRQAFLCHEQGEAEGCFAKLRLALTLAQGRRRANIAFLGARLALQRYLFPPEGAGGDSSALAAVQAFLDECLASDAGHPQAQWCSAAIRWLNGDIGSLAPQANAMDNPDVADPRYHYMAALCHLLGDQYDRVLSACERVVRDAGQLGGRNGSVLPLQLAHEAGYLVALARIGLHQPAAAVDALRPLACQAASPTLSQSQALLGNMLFREERHDEAIEAWQALDGKARQAWNLTEPLAQTTFLSALESLGRGEYELAATKFRQSGKLGCRDRRLGPLLLLALFKAGQQAIYGGVVVSS
jgi:tetratricopeptide (TPR) repeat protein